MTPGLLTVTVSFHRALPLVFRNVTAIVSGGWFVRVINAQRTAYLVLGSVKQLALEEQA